MTGRDVTNYTISECLSASNEDRTRDLALTKRMLCQLSYRGEQPAHLAPLSGFQKYYSFLPKHKPKRCHHPESHRGYRRHKPGYCSYTIAAEDLEDPGIDPGSQPCEGCMLPCTTIPQCASIGTRTRILSLEGINTTLVLWTHNRSPRLKLPALGNGVEKNGFIGTTTKK